MQDEGKINKGLSNNIIRKSGIRTKFSSIVKIKYQITKINDITLSPNR